MLSKEEFDKTFIRMMDSMRDTHKGELDCEGVYCNKSCPFDSCCGASHAFEIIDIAEKWAKEHPIVTNADKFEEVFGVKPIMINADDSYVCPERIGFQVKCGQRESCYNCKEKFWGAEYKAPTKSEVK